MTGTNRRSWPLATTATVRAAFWAFIAEFAPKYHTRRNMSVGQNDLPADLRMLWCDWLDAQAREGNVSPMMANKVTL